MEDGYGGAVQLKVLWCVDALCYLRPPPQCQVHSYFLNWPEIENVRSSLWQHVTRRHKTSWEDYIEEYGDPSTEVSLFSKT